MKREEFLNRLRAEKTIMAPESSGTDASQKDWSQKEKLNISFIQT